MQHILPIDTKLDFPSYTVVAATAGSGKTHTLTLRFVQLLLSDEVKNNAPRKILAITFTNQAASEMKRRLLTFLKRISLGDKELLEEMEALLSMKRDRIREKAVVVLAQILDQYSDLQIRTIDSFMAMVFKTSSFDFGFQPDLDIIFDNRNLLNESFESLTRDMPVRPELRNLLEKLVELIRETRKKTSPFLWDPYGRILWEVRLLYGRILAQEKRILSGGGLDEKRAMEKQIREKVEKFLRAIDESGFAPQKYMKDDLDDALAGKLDKVIDRKQKAPDKVIKKPGGSVRRTEYERQAELLSLHLDQFNRFLEQYSIWLAQNRFQPYIDAIRLMQEYLDRIRRRRGEILLDDINQTLRALLREETVADAYLMLGEQIHHFLIDEFQDTSPIQWANLRPLIENSLSQGGSLFVVGDTRQSIFSFRDADWKIMKRMMDMHEFPSARKFVYHLNRNWRSREQAVRYVEHVFETNVRASDLAAEAEKSGLSDVKQEVLKKNRGKGVAEVLTVQWDEEKRPEKGEILRLIADCKERGWLERDIAIITPTNERVLEVSGWLNSEGINVLPYSNLDIRTRKVTGELISLLRFLDSPVEDLSFAAFLTGDVMAANLAHDREKTGREELRDLLFDAARSESPRVRGYRKLQTEYPDLWKRYFEDIFRLAGYLPVYDLMCEVFRAFRLFDLCSDEEASLVKLLNVIREFGESDRNSLRDFLETAGNDKEISTWQVEVPADVEAVRLMTIHKAKGLEFNVTIVLLYDRDERSERYFFNEEDDGIRLLSITNETRARSALLDDVYQAQKQKDTVDRLNRLYVSLTRSRCELFVVSVEGDRIPIPSSLLREESIALPFRLPVEREPQDFLEKLVPFHTAGKVDYGEESTDPLGFVATERGRYIHLLLSSIVILDGDPATAVDRAMSAPGMTPPPFLDPAEIRRTVIGFLVEFGPDMFGPGADRTVLREQEYTAADGALLRMDRVIVDPSRVNVVDFKTGTRAADYTEQIRSYLAVLADCYPGSDLSGTIAYIDQLRLETIR